MNQLVEFQENLLKTVKNDFSRASVAKIHWRQRMFGVRGLRGVGKTTLLLQHLKFALSGKGLYVTADHPWFYKNTLFDLADMFYKDGGNTLLIDEIHKYPNWSTELKNIYDGYPNLQVIFTASSALDIQKGEADLSRRVIMYDLPGMSFREYLQMAYGHIFPTIAWRDLLAAPDTLTGAVNDIMRPLPYFKAYLRSGYFPFALQEEEGVFLQKLYQTINTVLEVDLASVEGYTLGNIIKLKKLLGIVAESVPFTPNISALAEKMKMSRDVVTAFIHHLERARMLNLLHRPTRGVAALQKPDKIYLENTNVMHAVKSQPDVGTVRETFFVNQLRNAGLVPMLPAKGDFQVDEYIFEIGGKSKALTRSIQNLYLAVDETEHPSAHRIPLWAFGFLY